MKGSTASEGVPQRGRHCTHRRRAGKWVLIQTTPYARCAHAAVNAVPQQPVNLQQQQQQQQPSPSPQTSPGSSAEGTPPQQPPQLPEQEQQLQQEQQPQRPASSGSGAELAGGGAGSDRGGGGAGSNATPPAAPPATQSAPPPVAANVLLYGGFSGEAVSGELLQLSFVRQSHAAGAGRRRGWSVGSAIALPLEQQCRQCALTLGKALA